MIFVQLLINGIIAGSIYALVAVGFSLIYATNRFVHFAHGGFVTVSAYLIYLFFSLVGLNFYISALLTILIAGFLGWLVYKLVYAPLKKRRASNAVLLIASVGLLILLENLMLLIFGADVKSVGYIQTRKGIEVFGGIITPLQIIIVIVTVVLLLVLWFFMKKSRPGKTMRAVADNVELANIIGIDANKVCYLSFVIGTALAGVAGILVALEQNIGPSMGTGLIIKGFTGAIIGGVLSVPGSILGSYLLGLVENFGIWFLPSGYKDAIAFALLFIFLLFKPTGILGLRGNEREQKL